MWSKPTTTRQKLLGDELWKQAELGKNFVLPAPDLCWKTLETRPPGTGGAGGGAAAGGETMEV